MTIAVAWPDGGWLESGLEWATVFPLSLIHLSKPPVEIRPPVLHSFYFGLSRPSVLVWKRQKRASTTTTCPTSHLLSPQCLLLKKTMHCLQSCKKCSRASLYIVKAVNNTASGMNEICNMWMTTPWCLQSTTQTPRWCRSLRIPPHKQSTKAYLPWRSQFLKSEDIWIHNTPVSWLLRRLKETTLMK